MPEQMIVRPATREDQQALAGFPDADKIEETFAAVDAGRAQWVVCEVDGAVVGDCVLDLASDLAPELRRLWVEPEQRRRGRGSAMAGWLEDRARDLGHDACFLVVDPENERMIPMAIELGYSATGDHIGLDNPDEVHDAAEQGDPHEGLFSIYRKSLTMA